MIWPFRRRQPTHYRVVVTQNPAPGSVTRSVYYFRTDWGAAKRMYVRQSEIVKRSNDSRESGERDECVMQMFRPGGEAMAEVQETE